MGIKTRNLFKLASKEDPIHLHKILGISCLINYVYQFYQLFIYGSMYLKDNPYTPLLMGIHACLSLSSFIFHVPLNRHKGLPMIYKESRLHAIVFSLRSVVCTWRFIVNLVCTAHTFHKSNRYYGLRQVNMKVTQQKQWECRHFEMIKKV